MKDLCRIIQGGQHEALRSSGSGATFGFVPELRRLVPAYAWLSTRDFTYVKRPWQDSNLRPPV